MAETANAHMPAYQNVTVHLHWLPRMVLAGTFLFHGIDKFGAGLAAVGDTFGFPTPVAFLVAAGEIGIGAALLVGGAPTTWAHWSTRAAGLGMATIMTGAIAIVHWGRWAFAPAEGFPAGGMEYQALLATLGIVLFLRGRI